LLHTTLNSQASLGSLLVLGVIEMVWNVFPSNAISSAVLQVSHYVLLLGLLFAPVPAPYQTKLKPF